MVGAAAELETIEERWVIWKLCLYCIKHRYISVFKPGKNDLSKPPMWEERYKRFECFISAPGVSGKPQSSQAYIKTSLRLALPFEIHPIFTQFLY